MLFKSSGRSRVFPHNLPNGIISVLVKFSLSPECCLNISKVLIAFDREGETSASHNENRIEVSMNGKRLCLMPIPSLLISPHAGSRPEVRYRYRPKLLKLNEALCLLHLEGLLAEVAVAGESMFR